MSEVKYFSQTRPEMHKYLPATASKILDVGCGEGRFLSEQPLSSKIEKWGMDIDAISAMIAEEKYHKVLIGDVQSNFASLPNDYFDCIVFNDILEHLVNPEEILLMANSKLLHNGTIIASIPNVRYITNLINLNLKKNWEYEEHGILDRTHLRFYTKKSIINMFLRLNFEIVKLEGINAIKDFRFTLLNIMSLGYLSDTRYLQYAVVAKPHYCEAEKYAKSLDEATPMICQCVKMKTS